MYRHLIYVAESDAAWVDSGKEKTNYKSLQGICIILIWNVSVTYHLLFLKIKQDVFPRYFDILYLHFNFFFLKPFFCFSDTLCSQLLTCSCCLLKLSPCTQVSQSDEIGKATNSTFRNTAKILSEKLWRRTNKARKLRESSFTFHHSFLIL